MGLGTLPPAGLDHLLLLCVEGSEVHRQGEKLFNNMYHKVIGKIWAGSGMCLQFCLSRVVLYVIYMLISFKKNMRIKPMTLVLSSPLCSTWATGTCWRVFLLFSGGLLHCYFSLFNVGSAADPWTYSSWSKKWHHILPLPWSNTPHRPTGTELLSCALYSLKILAFCDVDFETLFDVLGVDGCR